MESEVWIGLAEIRKIRDSRVLLDRNEAIVNVLALARDHDDFSATIRGALESLGLFLVSVEDVESLATRARAFEVDSSLLRLADEVRETGEVRFGKFHTWQSP